MYHLRILAAFVCLNLLVLLPPIWARWMKYEMWLSLIHFFIFFLRALFSWSSSSVFYGYFGCIALCASLVHDAREWLLDAIGTWYPSLEKVEQAQWFLMWLLFHGNDWLALRYGLPENGEYMVWVSSALDPYWGFQQV